MQVPLSLANFTPDRIMKDEFVTVLPEYYELKAVVESQPWHDHQTVFDHSLKSAVALETIIRFEQLPEPASTALTNYLAQKYENHSRLQVLRLATLLHDAGKLISLQHDPQGNTSSPSHGVLGAWVARPLVDKFAMADSEKQVVLDLITNHLVATDLIEMSVANNTSAQKVVELLQAHRPDIAVELVVLGYADWLGCDIRATVREERQKRVARVHECLRYIASRLQG